MSRPASNAAPEPTPRLVFLMALSCALAVSAIYYHQPLLPQIASTFGVTVTDGNFIATVTQLGYAAGLLLVVPLADSIQPRKLASLAITGNALALLACAWAPTFALLAIASAFVGMTAITAQIIIPAASGSASAANRGRIVGTLLGGLSSGVLLARTLSGLVGAHMGWRTMFVLASVVDAALLVVVARLPVSTELSAIRYGDLMHSLLVLVREEPRLRASVAVGFLTFAAFSAFWASLAALLAQPPYAYGPAAVGAFGLVGLFGLVASPRIGALVDRFETRKVVSVGAIFLVAAFAVLAIGAKHMAGLILSIILLDLGSRASFIANQTRVQGLRPNARSRLNTVFMVSYFLGGAAGAALGAYGAQHGGWAGVAAVGGLLGFAALAISAVAPGNAGAANMERQTSS